MNFIKRLSVFERRLWLISVTLIALLHIFQKDQTVFQLIASLIGVTSLIFMAKGDVTGQWMSVVFCCMYAVISWQFRYYGELMTYLFMSLPIAVLSIVEWMKNPYAENEVKVAHLKPKHWMFLVICTVVVTVVFHFVLKYFNTPNLLVGTLSIATSFLAASLMMLRSPYYAVAYAFNDVVLITLWILASLVAPENLSMVLCFSIFLANDIYAYHSWKQMRKRQDESMITSES